MIELKEHNFCESDEFFREYPGPLSNEVHLYYLKSDADAAIDKIKAAHHKERHEYINMIAELKADYKEACDRLQTATLIKDEQKAKADKLLSCLKCLVMRGLIKDCPEKASAIEIVKEYENGLG